MGSGAEAAWRIARDRLLGLHGDLLHVLLDPDRPARSRDVRLPTALRVDAPYSAGNRPGEKRGLKRSYGR